MRFNFETAEQYTEAWMYLMRTCSGFTYCRDERWIEPTLDGDADTNPLSTDEWTIERLKRIQAGEVLYGI